MKKEDVKRASDLLRELDGINKDIVHVKKYGRLNGVGVSVRDLVSGTWIPISSRIPTGVLESYLRQEQALKEQALKELGVDLGEPEPEEQTTIQHDRAGRRPK